LRPWYKVRAKNVFRDLSCLPAGSSLEAELFARLDQSDHLIVLACPETARSAFQLTRLSGQAGDVVPSGIEDIAIASNGRMAVAFHNDARVEIFEPEGSSTVLPLSGGHAPRVPWSVDSTRLVAGDCLDATVRVALRYAPPAASSRVAGGRTK